MNELLVDWCSFCEGRAVFDKSHFSNLFRGMSSGESLTRILSYFPNYGEVEARIRILLSSTDSGANRGSVAKLLRVASADLRVKIELCERIGESDFASQFKFAKATFASCDRLTHEPKDLDSRLFEFIGDYVGEARAFDDDRLVALEEALYGLTTDYYLSWYLGAPLFLHGVDFEPYFELWKNGGKSLLIQSGLLVSYRNGKSSRPGHP